jgi:membrane peptidoglycan carboxypeptidase
VTADEKTMIKKLFYFFLFLSFSIILTAAGGLYYLIVVNPGSEIEASNIEAILGKESPVFYSDNTTKLGVFFDEAHRQYVRYDEIPRDFVNALVAAEDNSFFDHFGFDPLGIARAAIRNIEAGRVVQGGSTLTQQTAKNLFKRSERSFKAKFKELLFALRLEHRYPKEKIFEFYSNQFYVSGNGHGLGVAARYYFDKKPSELNLVQCAFIAGSVKSPNYYNPFIKKTAEGAELAKERARIRLKYVLSKMLELQMIGQDVYIEALVSDIGFMQGQVGYSLDYVMEMVKDAVSTTEVLTELEKHGIDNVSTSGIRIITTVDKDIQEKALYSLRHDLSRLDVMLRGYEREEVQKEYAQIEFGGDSRLETGSFLFGTVRSIAGSGDKIAVTVDFGRKNGSAIIDKAGFDRLVEARVKWQKNTWTKASGADLKKFVNQLQIGDTVWVSVREKSEESGNLLDLEKYPKVQGGALVMKDGAIRAMAGGTENRFYNRAVYAKRTMGSSFKPFVFAAALQLGWNSSDLLKNSRDVFIYHNQPYFPRPDHDSPFEHVSMSWAGVKSENLASVWLLTHLCDNLTPIQFRDLAENLGLAPQESGGDSESYRAYRTRIRDKYGIVVKDDTLQEAAFQAAVRNSEADFMFENMVSEYSYFKSLHYGLGFDKYIEQIDGELANTRNLKGYERNELLLRRQILSMNYLVLEGMRNQLRAYSKMIEDPIGLLRADPFAGNPNGGELYYDNQTGRYIFQPRRLLRPYLEIVNREGLQEQLYDLSNGERNSFWQKVYLYGEVSVGGLDLLSKQIEFESQRLQKELPYSFEVLSEIDDFRIYTGLRYLIALAREMGIRSELDAVLSFPLGSNVVSLLEATRMYEGLVTGKITSYGEDPQNEENDSLLILDRIESEDGTLLYKPKRHDKVVFDARATMGIGHILENVIKYGTGRAADKEVRLGKSEKSEINSLDLTVPLLGKTGTANRYTNASFFGFLPGLTNRMDGMTTEEGYAVGTYVGFDDNSSMRHSSVRISGAAGALPTWIDIVNELIRFNKYADYFDPVELSFNGLQLKRGDVAQVNLGADQDNGGIVAEPVRKINDTDRYQPSILTFGEVSANGRFVPERHYEPFWKVAASEQ